MRLWSIITKRSQYPRLVVNAHMAYMEEQLVGEERFLVSGRRN
jgi:hypothetical protein